MALATRELNQRSFYESVFFYSFVCFFVPSSVWCKQQKTVVHSEFQIDFSFDFIYFLAHRKAIFRMCEIEMCWVLTFFSLLISALCALHVCVFFCLMFHHKSMLFSSFHFLSRQLIFINVNTSVCLAFFVSLHLYVSNRRFFLLLLIKCIFRCIN